jgi:predicted DNA-binding transcriptional regulator YafY
MSKSSYQQVVIRRNKLVELLSGGEQDMVSLCRGLPGRPSRRTVTDDLRWVKKLFPHQLIRNRHSGHACWSLTCRVPHILPEPLDVVTAEQMVALIAARSLLRLPDANAPQLERSATGELASAIDALISRCGLTAAVQHIAPSIIMASRHGIPTEPTGYFLKVVEAIIQRHSLTFMYDNNRNETKSVHTQPQRLVAIHGSWYCFAWTPDKSTPPGRIKQYRLARMSELKQSTSPVNGLPRHISAKEIDDCLAESFGATGSNKTSERKRIVLAVSPEGWPHLRDCIWGTRQVWDEKPADLPTGFRRLSFTTTGLNEARHKILSLGAAVRAEGPPELVDWLHQQATAMLAETTKQRATLTAKSPDKRSHQP